MEKHEEISVWQTWPNTSKVPFPRHVLHFRHMVSLIRTANGCVYHKESFIIYTHGEHLKMDRARRGLGSTATATTVKGKQESINISPSINSSCASDLSVMSGILLKFTEITLLKMKRKKVLSSVPKCIFGLITLNRRTLWLLTEKKWIIMWGIFQKYKVCQRKVPIIPSQLVTSGISHSENGCLFVEELVSVWPLTELSWKNLC